MGANLVMMKDTDGNPTNIIYKYYILTVEDIRTHAMAYIYHKTRKAQNSIHMYHFISNSITEAIQLKIVE